MSWDQLIATGRANQQELVNELIGSPRVCPHCGDGSNIEDGRQPNTWHCSFDGVVFGRGGVLILLP